MCVGNTHPWETHITVTPVKLLLLLLLINSVKTSIEDYTQMNLLYLAILLVVYSSID